MNIDLWDQANKRLRPSEGWLVLLLVAAAVGLLVTAVREVRWVPEDDVIIPTAVFGLLLGTVLAKRPLHAFFAWSLLTVYGLLMTTLFLAQLIPPYTVWTQGWEPTRLFWLHNGAIFLDRAGGWLVAVSSGGSSPETLVFAYLLGLLTFFLAAFAGWATFRWQRPLPGLLIMGLALALNSYFGTSEIWWVGLFVGAAVLLTALLNYAHLEKEWTDEQVDFPEDVRLEMTGYAVIIASALLIFALALPTFSISRLQAWFVSLRPVEAVESTFGQAFAGIDIPRQQTPLRPAHAGILPRQYLLGIAPELAETVILTAVVSIQVEDREFLAPPALLQGTHWRAISYDVYTGYGWAISEERVDPTGAFQMIPVPLTDGQTTLTQFVYEQEDERSTRYTTGLPVRFEHATIVSWRGLDDLVRVRTQTPCPASAYKAVSRLTTAVPDDLRQSRLADVPAPLLARYTVLPENTPQRVRDLAQEIAGEYENPYDQARALEQFLRQYPYSLAVPEPPYGADPVDYFLFDLQTGYCDYYASSMVVLARTLGLPARLAVGFMAQPPDEAGVQTLRQVNGHSWAEVYFAGYGWVEFEPTASFASPRDTVISAFDPANFMMEFEPPFQETYTPPPIPEARPFPWLRLLVLALIAAGLLYLWWQQREERALRADGVVWAYSRLQLNARKLGQPPAANQTPQEFTNALLNRLGGYGRRPRLRPTLAAMQTHIDHITHLYNERRYGGYELDERLPVGQPAARRAWGKLRRPFWRLRLLHRFSRKL